MADPTPYQRLDDSSNAEDYMSANRHLTDRMREFQGLVSEIAALSSSKQNMAQVSTVEDVGRKIDQGTTNATAIQQLLKEFSMFTNECTNPSERRQRRFQFKKLSKDFQKLCEQFERTVQQTMKQEKSTLAQPSATSSATYQPPAPPSQQPPPEEQFPRPMDNPFAAEPSTQQFSMQMHDEIRQNEHDMALREQEFQHLQSSVTQIHEIFNDISIAVNEQGEQIQLIEMNVESAHEQTTGAVEQLQKALKKQKVTKSKVAKWVLGITLALSLLIILFQQPWKA